MRFGSARSRAVVPAALLFFIGARTAGAAEPRDAVAAEALFEEARQLFEQGKYDAACPKFDESYRLDPATGVLFALALCHERSGKLATAWAEFRDVAGRANAERNTERETAARQRAEALLPRLSYLVIDIDPAALALSGLSIQYDGVALRPAAFGSALPVDPGRHLVRAEAPEHQPWEGSVEIGTQAGRQTITVPALTPLPPKPTAPLPPSKATASKQPGVVELTPLRVGAIALGGAGIASLGIGTAALVHALDKKASSDGQCGAQGCTQAGQNDRLVAREAATWATVGAVSGVALLGAGAVLWFLGKPPAPAPRVGGLTVLVGPRSVGIAGAL